jgi:hypothetical protein
MRSLTQIKATLTADHPLSRHLFMNMANLTTLIIVLFQKFILEYG